MQHILFGQQYSYGRVGLAMIGVGMGLHLVSGALNQAALARDRVAPPPPAGFSPRSCSSSGCSCRSSANELMRAELGYARATATARPGADAPLPPRPRTPTARAAQRAQLSGSERAERRRKRRVGRPGIRGRRSRSRPRTRWLRPARQPGAVVGSIPPSTSIDRRVCDEREPGPTFSRERAMKAWPPQPG